jgi:RimJ/RimL family protein N-acetyltransferase
MIRITPAQVTPAVRALFRTDEMQAKRCFAVLEGSDPAGKILVDNLSDPCWGLVLESVDNDLFLGGNVDPAAIATAFAAEFAALRREGDVLTGLPPGDPRLALFPADPYYDGWVLEFYDRPTGQGLEPLLRQLPADCVIRRMDRALVMRTEWGPGDVEIHGGLDRWEKACLGYVLMRGDEILSEASVGPSAMGGWYEPGVFTQESQRGKGYGTMVTARLIQALESIGGQTYWNCAKQNPASSAIARKLGYRVEKEFRCLAWRKTDR